MKESFYRLMSCALALLLLFSTSSFALDMHYCGDTLIDFSLLNNSATCGMTIQEVEDDVRTNACETSQVRKKSCCSDKHFQSDGQDDLRHAVEQLPLSADLFLAGFVYTYQMLFEEPTQEHVHFRQYRPPNIENDLQVLHQTFLI